MSFIETPRFPSDISYGSSGGPGFNTDVVTVNSGYETRNQNWVQSRSEYDAAFGIRQEPQLSELLNFFQSMAGKVNGFRYKDWGDYLSCNLKTVIAQDDQSLGTGDSTDGTDGTADYQIVKNYITGTITRVRDIYKPISGTLLVEVNSILVIEGTEYNVDYTTGIITFLPTFVPLISEEVKCGYEYDVPCRFDTDTLNINFEAYSVGSVTIPIIEIRI